MRNIRTRQAAWLVLPVAAVLTLAGCSDNKKSSADKSPSPTPSASTSPTAGAGNSPSAAPSVDTATFSADQKAAAAAYTTLFDAKATLDQRKAVIQNASAIDSLITTFATNPQMALVSSQVKDVKVNGDTADVTLDILLSGAPIAPNSSNQAIKVDGKWLVPTKVICGLGTQYLQVPAASLPPGCAS